jgi:hypothetical protein
VEYSGYVVFVFSMRILPGSFDTGDCVRMTIAHLHKLDWKY